MTNAVIASTIGTALGTTHGSCLPFPFISVASKDSLIVSCVCIIVATGLNATLKSIGIPLEIPP